MRFKRNGQRFLKNGVRISIFNLKSSPSGNQSKFIIYKKIRVNWCDSIEFDTKRIVINRWSTRLINVDWWSMYWLTIAAPIRHLDLYSKISLASTTKPKWGGRNRTLRFSLLKGPSKTLNSWMVKSIQNDTLNTWINSCNWMVKSIHIDALNGLIIQVYKHESLKAIYAFAQFYLWW